MRGRDQVYVRNITSDFSLKGQTICRCSITSNLAYAASLITSGSFQKINLDSTSRSTRFWFTDRIQSKLLTDFCHTFHQGPRADVKTLTRFTKPRCPLPSTVGWNPALHLLSAVLAILSPEQISHLSTFIADSYGVDLTFSEVADCIGMCLEDIAGAETASVGELQEIHSLIAGAYHDSIRQRQESK